MINKEEKISINNLLRKTELFATSDDKLLDIFCKNAITKDYLKGETIFLHEQKASYFFIIINGLVKLFKESKDGDEAIIDIIGQNKTFAENAIFTDNKYPYSAEAIEDSNIALISLESLKQQIEQNHQLAINMLKAAEQKKQNIKKQLEHRDLQTAPQRIGCFILGSCKDAKANKTSLNMPYEKTLLATKLGMKPETFSRALNSLKKDASVKVEGKTIRINDINKLVKYCCGACSSSFPCDG